MDVNGIESKLGEEEEVKDSHAGAPAYEIGLTAKALYLFQMLKLEYVTGTHRYTKNALCAKQI